LPVGRHYDTWKIVSGRRATRKKGAAFSLQSDCGDKETSGL